MSDTYGETGLTKEKVIEAFKTHGKRRLAAESLGVTLSVLDNAVNRSGWYEDVLRARNLHGVNQAQESVNQQVGNETGVDIKGSGELPLGDLENVLKKRGLDTDQWLVDTLRLGEWEAQVKGGGMETMYSIRAVVRPMDQLVLRAARNKPTKPILAKKPNKGKSQLVAFLSDQHAPFHDVDLHERVLSWLKDNNPDKIILPGDLLDLDTMSRHPFDPKWTASMQECIDAGSKIIADYRACCPGAEIVYFRGNHEERSRSKVIDRIRELYGVRRAGSEVQALSLEWLLALDDYKVSIVGDEDTPYENHQLRIADDLVVRHGSKTAKGAGASALKELDRMTHGLVMGHSHRQGLVRKTVYDDYGRPKPVWAMEVGTLAMTAGGLGYAPRPDWQNGFGTAMVHSDGTHECELVPVVDGTLRWRGKKW